MPAAKNSRQPLLLVVIGAPNTGKSFKVSQLFEKSLKVNGVVFSNNWPGAGLVIAPGPDVKLNEKKMFRTFCSSVNRLFIIDDSRQWLKSPYNPAAEMYYLLAEQRARNIDLVFIVHSWKQVPVFLIDYNLKILIFPAGVRGLAEFAENCANKTEIFAACKKLVSRSVKEKYPCILVDAKNS